MSKKRVVVFVRGEPNYWNHNNDTWIPTSSNVYGSDVTPFLGVYVQGDVRMKDGDMVVLEETSEYVRSSNTTLRYWKVITDE